MKSLVLMFVRPRAAVEEIRRSPSWLLSFGVLALLCIVVVVWAHRGIVEFTLAKLPPSTTLADKEEMKEYLDGRLAVTAAFLPVRLVTGWMSFALILYYTCMAWTSHRSVRFVHVLALEVHAEAALVAGRVAGAVAAMVRGAPSTSAGLHSPYRVPFGIDMLFPSSSDFAVAAFLNSLNVFAVWYIFLLTMGISGLYGIRVWKVALTAVGLWLLVALCNAVVLHALRDAFQFQLT